MSPAVTDLVVVAVILLSGVLALSRGLVREVLGVAGWVGAAFITLYGFRHVQPFAREFIPSTYIADPVAGVGLFIASLIVLTYLSHAIAGRVKDSGFSALDRTLGFLFGLARGAVLICLAYLVMVWLVPPKEQPDWIVSARTMPLVQSGAEVLRSLAPEDMRGPEPARPERPAAAPDWRSLLQPQPKGPEPEKDAGYGREERQQMDRLFRSNQ